MCALVLSELLHEDSLLMPCQTESGDHLPEEWERNQKTLQVIFSLTTLLQKTALGDDIAEDRKDLWSWWTLVRR